MEKRGGCRTANVDQRTDLLSNIATYTSALSTTMIFDLLYSLYFHAHFDEAFTMKRARSIMYEANRKPSIKIMEEEE